MKVLPLQRGDRARLRAPGRLHAWRTAPRGHLRLPKHVSLEGQVCQKLAFLGDSIDTALTKRWRPDKNIPQQSTLLAIYIYIYIYTYMCVYIYIANQLLVN